MDNDFATGYALGADSNGGGNGGGGMWGGDGSWIFAFLIIALIFGGQWGFGNGNGNGGNGGVVPVISGMVTRADITDGFMLNDLQRSVAGIQQGICDSTYALNNAITGGFNTTQMGMMQGFNGVDRSLCQLGYNLQDCCCKTQNAIQGVRYDLATQSCDTRQTINTAARDIIDSQNSGTRAILDALSAQAVAAKDAKIAEQNQQIFQLQLAASQSNQNAVLMAAMDANTAAINRSVGAIHPQPVPSYQVPAPYPYCGTSNHNCGCYGCAA